MLPLRSIVRILGTTHIIRTKIREHMSMRREKETSFCKSVEELTSGSLCRHPAVMGSSLNCRRRVVGDFSRRVASNLT